MTSDVGRPGRVSGRTRQRKALVMKHKIVLIEWVDSMGDDGRWQDTNEIKPLLPGDCVSIGFLLTQNRDYVTIAESIGSDPSNPEMVMARLTIPTCSIKKKTELKIPGGT